MRNGSAIVITYNSAAQIKACLDGIRRSPGWDALIIENGSSDPIARELAGIPFQLRLVRNPFNRGFAAAANQGESHSSADIIALLNPDVVPEPGSLDTLARAFDDPTVGAAGGALLDANGLPQKGFQLRRFPTLLAMLCEVLLLNRLWPGNPWNRRYRCLDLDDTQPQFVEQPAGACIAVRRHAWESIGGFDENFYPVWFEDVDFCRRLISHGWKIAYRPDARFSHLGGHSVSSLAFRDQQAFWYGNMVRYFSKHHGRFRTHALRVGIFAGLALRSLISLVGLGPRGIPAKEAVKGYAHAARTVLQRNPLNSSKQTHAGVTAV